MNTLAEFSCIPATATESLTKNESIGPSKIYTLSPVELTLLKLNSAADDVDMVRFKDDDYIDEFADDSFNDYMDFVDENKIPENTKLVQAIDEEGKATETKTVKQIKKELEQEKRMLDELTKCEGLDL